MQQFIGTKIISAKPMTRAEFVAYRYPNQPHNPDAGNPDDAGYLVEYHDGGAPNHPNHNGYISWSPKEVFDSAYVEIGNVAAYPLHQQRVFGEKAALDDKIVKLEAFFHTEIYEGLDPAEKERLRDQLAYMRGYSSNLNARIGAFIGTPGQAAD